MRNFLLVSLLLTTFLTSTGCFKNRAKKGRQDFTTRRFEGKPERQGPFSAVVYNHGGLKGQIGGVGKRLGIMGFSRGGTLKSAGVEVQFIIYPPYKDTGHLMFFEVGDYWVDVEEFLQKHLK